MTRRRRPRTAEERLIAAVGSVARGVAGGRVRNVRQVSPHARGRNTGPAGVGFDPNADPVVIGLNAEADGPGRVAVGVGAHGDGNNSVAVGDAAATFGPISLAIGSGASAGSAGSTHNTAIGGNAQAGSDATNEGVAVGFTAQATGGNSVAVGSYAHAAAADAVAIGDTAVAPGAGDTVIGANANGGVGASQHCTAIGEYATIDGARDSATALGYSSAARADNATALGAVSNARHAHATAVGAGAATSAANQVMLGTTADFVEIPGVGAANGLVLTDNVTGTRYIIQIASGALVLNTAP